MDQRRALNRAYEADRLRQRIKGGVLLRQLTLIDRELKSINQYLRDGAPVLDEKNKPVIDKATGSPIVRLGVSDDEGRAIMLRVGVLKTRMDLNFKKLAKILPDLKGVELIDPSKEGAAGELFKAIAQAARDHGDQAE